MKSSPPPKQHPSKDWLDFVTTSKAKTKIRHWIKTGEKADSINLGKSILEKALQQEHIPITNLLKSEYVAQVAKELSFQSPEELVAQIGFGKISAKQVITRLKPRLGIEKDKPQGIVGKVVSRLKRPKKDHGIKVDGMSDMLVSFANCCNPLPGEKVVGFITRGRGITIHRKICTQLKNVDSDHLVDVTWDTSDKEVYTAKLKIISVERKGMLADVSMVISQKDANIIHAEAKSTVDNKGIALFTIEVQSYRQLQEIMGALKKVRSVLIVKRV